MGLWITFVDMKGKNVLLTKYIENKPGGFGFMAYWAKPIYLALKDVKSDYNSWK
jgi:hypothetical protein